MPVKASLIASILLLLAGSSFGQLQRFSPIAYLGEINSGGPTSRATKLKVALAKVTRNEFGVVLEGRSATGRQWQAVLENVSGWGRIDLWQADFDRNGQKDLLIVSFFASCGRCLDGCEAHFLMFDSSGLPFPWTIETRMPVESGSPRPPLLLQKGREGRAQLIHSTCEYSDPPRFGEDRRLAGVYEASEARWDLAVPKELRAYTVLLRRNYVFRHADDALLPAKPAAWQNLGNAPLPSPREVQLGEVASPLAKCTGVRIHIVDGQVSQPEHDPCDVLGKHRMVLSDGTTCFGWPVVVIDRPSGREIRQDSRGREEALRAIASKRLSAMLYGQVSPGQCSPTVLAVREQ